MNEELESIRLFVKEREWIMSYWGDVSAGGPELYRSKAMRLDTGETCLIFIDSRGKVNIHELRSDHTVINLDLADPEFFDKLSRVLNDPDALNWSN